MRARIAAALRRALAVAAVAAVAFAASDGLVPASALPAPSRAASAAAADDSPVSGYTGPNAIAVPYTGEKVVKPAEGWTIEDCGAVRAAGAPLVTACDPAQGFTVVSPGYDPDYGELVVPVALSNGRSRASIDYVLRLEPPAAPELPVATYPFPAPAGGVLLIPISDLGVQCTACAEGGGLEVTSFAPAGAATVLPTETHLVVRPRAGFEGPLEVTVRFGDMYGGWSQPTVLTVPVSRQGADAPVAQHVLRPLPADGGRFDLAELVAAPGGEGAADMHFLCGGAIHGAVVCDAAGTATYTPFEEAAVDQFSFHVARGGDLVTGSVTLVAPGAGETPVALPDTGVAVTEPRTSASPAPTPQPDPEEAEEAEEADAPGGDGAPGDDASGSDGGADDEQSAPQELVLLRVATPIAPPPPPAESGGRTGLFTPLVELLDRVGAR